MVFSGLLFLYVFLPLCMILHFMRRSVVWRNAVLIVFSLIFYAWGEPTYVFLMLATALLNWAGARLFARIKRRRLWLAFIVALDLLILGSFKYAGLFSETLSSLFELAMPQSGIVIPTVRLALPIGISFYMFQSISYVIDVYRGTATAQRSFARLLLYIALFPQLIAGPIIRYGSIAEQLGNRPSDICEIRAGIERFIVGLAKKSVLANACGVAADALLNPARIESIGLLGVWFGVLMFALQIYLDFSAYSDMAIGMGRMLGFRYPENFNYPYLSRSASEFWRRWHISLGSFFRDYLYIPLGGNRRHMYLNLFIVWALTGLWHGASWNFVLWGLYWFFFISIEKLFLKRVLKHLPPPFPRLYFLALMLTGWVLFYYTDLSDALRAIARMYGAAGTGPLDPFSSILMLNNLFLLVISLLACTPLLPAIKRVYEHIQARGAVTANLTAVIKYLLLAALLLLCTLMLAGNSFNPFIYFRF